MLTKHLLKGDSILSGQFSRSRYELPRTTTRSFPDVDNTMDTNFQRPSPASHPDSSDVVHSGDIAPPPVLYRRHGGNFPRKDQVI